MALGLINDHLFVYVYVDWDTKPRVTLLRKANKRKVKRYSENLK